MGKLEDYIIVPDEMRDSDYRAVAFAESVNEVMHSMQRQYGISDDDMEQLWDVLKQALKRAMEVGEHVGTEALKAADRIVDDENNESEGGGHALHA